MSSERYELKVVGPRGLVLDPVQYIPDISRVKGAVLMKGGEEKKANVFVVAFTEAAEKLRGILQKGPVLDVNARWENLNKSLGGYLIENVEDVG